MTCELCGTTEEVVPGCGPNEDQSICITCEVNRRLREMFGL